MCLDDDLSGSIHSPYVMNYVYACPHNNRIVGENGGVTVINVVMFPPISVLSSHFCSACLTTSSMYMLNSNGESGQP